MSEYLYVVGFLEDIAGAPLPGDGITARALGGTYIDIDADHSGVVSAPAVADGEVRLRLHRKPGVVYELTSPGRMVPRFVSCSDHPSGATLYLHDLPAIPPGGTEVVPTVTVVELSARIDALAASVGSGGGVTDHGALTGLDDDDHPQYLTAVRGDARYGLPIDATNAPGVDATGATDSTAAIQAVLNTAAAATYGANGRPVRLVGTFRINSTLTVNGDVDFAAATFHYYGSGTAIQVGSSSAGHLWGPVIHLGQVICMDKPAGASWITGSVGVCLRNVFGARVAFRRIANFETNLLLQGDGSYGQGGCGYNTIIMGLLDTGKVNESLQIVSSGVVVQAWCNDNTHIGGSLKHFVGAYPQAGTRQIQIHTPTSVAASINNNRWISTSLEGGMQEYVIDCNGSDNVWRDCRFEFTGNGGKAPVIWRQLAKRNRIDGGYGAASIAVAAETGAVANSVSAADSAWLDFSSADGLVLSNDAGGSSATLTLMRAGWRALGDTVAASWLMRITNSRIRMKSSGDTSERMIIDGTLRQISFSDGIATTGVNTPIIMGGYASPENTVTAPPGSIYIAYATGGAHLWVKGSGVGATGWHIFGESFATAARPTAAAAGIGGSYYDTALSKPMWSDGTTWRDAAGTAV